MTLDADIARIAALRGRPVSDFEPKRRGISTTQLEQLLHMDSDTKADLRVHDALPAASRRLIAEWERPINTRAWASLLEQFMDEEFLIRTFKAWYRQTTGREGPSPVRKPRRRMS